MCAAVSSWPRLLASPDTDRGLLKKNGCGICASTDPAVPFVRYDTSRPTPRLRQTRKPTAASNPGAGFTSYVVLIVAVSTKTIGCVTPEKLMADTRTWPLTAMERRSLRPD